MTQPQITFFSGTALLLLLIFYMGTVQWNRKRILGTALSILVSAFFLWALSTMGIKKGIDLQGGSSFVVELQRGENADGTPKEVSPASVQQAIGILEKRLNPDGSADQIIIPTGNNRIEIQMPGVSADAIASVREKIQKVAKLDFRLVDSSGAESKPGWVRMNFRDPKSEGEKSVLVSSRPDLDGKYVERAMAALEPKGWVIHLIFNSDGTKLFGELTSANVGKRLAVVVDGAIESAPVLRDAITGGNCEISGSFNEESARNLASALENPLENPMKILQESTVSASFGEATIKQGIEAGLVGLALTAIFMVIYYRVAGLIALIGLSVSVICVIGGMALFQFTLTMPGIAGLVLTIAMAVDANVLIYERLREEMRSGKTLAAALDTAHDRAFTAIFDAHVTTLITSLILLAMASGMLKGFAITLIIGVFSTLLGALVVTRVFVHWFVDPGIITTMKLTTIIPNRVFNVMQYGFQFVMFSTIVSVFALAVLGYKGKHSLGIDYRGGSKISFTVAKDKTLPVADVEAKLKTMQVDGKPIGTAYVQDSLTLAGDHVVTVRAEEFAGPGVQKQIGDIFKEQISGVTIETAGALIGGELATKSFWAVVLALFGIFFYLYVRYEFSFALGALVSIFHDCIIVLGFSVMFGQELSLVHIGAVLTVAGYSVNDTIIVFDRVREIVTHKKGSITELMNEAISNTFSRTILTSLVTFIPMMVLYLFGGPAMREFSLPIVIGVVIGSYSSIFVAAPIVLWHAKRTGKSLHQQLLPEEAPATP